ncbi:hypothetical protein BJ508DRAFT_311028 [Ascobolus immersus RN42]|uniref:Uncharacterized protein n=1 Tax=Ascobolus immersus RN42 TaxID=1160509 RepID=A0A3N4HXF1_ASCIM|nr:hypothetical protein BJ508DRAFT_311028 [Ascobolus immersus RN42]
MPPAIEKMDPSIGANMAEMSPRIDVAVPKMVPPIATRMGVANRASTAIAMARQMPMNGARRARKKPNNARPRASASFATKIRINGMRRSGRRKNIGTSCRKKSFAIVGGILYLLIEIIPWPSETTYFASAPFLKIPGTIFPPFTGLHLHLQVLQSFAEGLAGIKAKASRILERGRSTVALPACIGCFSLPLPLVLQPEFVYRKKLDKELFAKSEAGKKGEGVHECKVHDECDRHW